jgi:hypothetical protein
VADVFDIGADAFGDVGQLVHERDLGRQHRVGGVFRELGRAEVHHHQPVVVTVEWGVELAHRFDRTGAVGAGSSCRGAGSAAAPLPRRRSMNFLIIRIA